MHSELLELMAVQHHLGHKPGQILNWSFIQLQDSSELQYQVWETVWICQMTKMPQPQGSRQWFLREPFPAGGDVSLAALPSLWHCQGGQSKAGSWACLPDLQEHHHAETCSSFLPAAHSMCCCANSWDSHWISTVFMTEFLWFTLPDAKELIPG